MSNASINKARRTGVDLTRLQSSLGYEFENPELLAQALTHKSHSKQNNERLEFVGDAVLGYVVGHMLYQLEDEYAEDILSLMRANLVRGTSLASIARSINVADYLQLGSGERKSGGRDRDSILADAMEAIIGAIHEDGGIQACIALVERLFTERIQGLDPQALKDAKTVLQERLQGQQHALPSYDVLEVAGADHARRYTVRCRVEELDIEVQATASSRRRAEQASADKMLQVLSNLNSKGS